MRQKSGKALGTTPTVTGTDREGFIAIPVQQPDCDHTRIHNDHTWSTPLKTKQNEKKTMTRNFHNIVVGLTEDYETGHSEAICA